MTRRRLVGSLPTRPVRPAVFAVVLAIFLAVLYDQVNISSRASASQDVFGAAWLPYELLHHGTVDFDDVYPAMERAYPDRTKFGFTQIDGHYYSRFPITAGVLATPVYAVAILLDGDIPDTDLPRVARTAAAIMAALAVALLYLALRPISGEGWARVLATAFGLGTTVWTVAGATLWQEGGALLALAGFLAAVAYVPSRPRLLLAAGLALGTFVVARPPVLIMIPALMAGLVLTATRSSVPRERVVRLLAGALALAAVPVVLTGWYNWAVFGAPWSSGYGDKATTRWTGQLIYSLPGGLLGLTRGIVPTAPFLALGIFAFAGFRPDLRSRDAFRRWLASEPPLRLSALGGAVAFILLISKWFHWWGGIGPGPRLNLNAWPLLLVLVAYACVNYGDRRWFRVAFAASVVWAVCLRLVMVALHSNNFMQGVTAEGTQRDVFLRLFSIRHHELVTWLTSAGA